jgi:glycosyltransferase involved in cell wall biosynthesis
MHQYDPADWRTRHADGLVPDALPYGLDRLVHYGLEVSSKPVSSRPLQVVDSLARKLSGGFEFVEAFRSRVRRECDVTLCWEEHSGVPAALRSRLPGEPAVATGVIWLTEPDAPLSRRGRVVAAEGLRRASAIWALSPPQLDVLANTWRLDSKRLHLLHMGIDVCFWNDGGSEPEPELVLSAGNDRHRDHAYLVDAMIQLHRRRPKTQLQLVTHSPVDMPCAVGRRHPCLTHPEMRSLYRRASVVALALKPNLHLSGLSVLLEAMACARPVVMTDSPGLSEYLTDGEAGLIVPHGHPEAMARAVEDLLADPEGARSLGANGRRLVEAFSTEAQAERLAEIIRAASV